MKEQELRSILRELGVTHQSRTTVRGWVAFPCPMGPYLHRSGKVNLKQYDAAAKIEDHDISVWKCQSCNSTGRISTLVRQLTRARDGHIDEALTRKAETSEMGVMLDAPDFEDRYKDHGQELPEPIDEELYEGAFPMAVEVPEAMAYLASRGVGDEAAEKMDLMFDPDDNRVIFPVRDAQAKLYGYTGRDITGQAKLKVKDYFGLPKRHLILGEHRWRPNTPKLIVEGLFGYARLIEIGAEAMFDVGAILGSVITDEKAARLKSWACGVFLMLDNDEAGEAGIFGKTRPDGTVDQETSGLAKLMNHVPTMVPAWPVWDRHVVHLGVEKMPGQPKTDPDELTMDDLRIVATTWPYVPPPTPQRKFKPRA